MSGVSRFFTISLVVLAVIVLSYFFGIRNLQSLVVMTVIASVGGGLVYMAYEPKEEETEKIG